MKAGITGHRPDKLIGGWELYQDNGVGQTFFVDFLASYLTGLGIEIILVGMAVGFDTIACLGAERTEDTWFEAYVPFYGHHRKWKQSEQRTFQNLIESSSCRKVHTPEKIPTNYGEICAMLNQRNKDIVDSGIDVLIALWNGTSGGTANCIKYANKVGVPVLNLWDEYALLADREFKKR